MKAHKAKMPSLTDGEKAAILAEMRELRKQGKTMDEIAEIVGRKVGLKGSLLKHFIEQYKEEQ